MFTPEEMKTLKDAFVEYFDIQRKYYGQSHEEGRIFPPRSEEIKELATALSKAQGEFLSPEKNATNPYGRGGKAYNYTDLPEYISCTKKALSENGLSVTQLPQIKDNDTITIETVLLHASGQWISNFLKYKYEKGEKSMPKIQEMGGSITYIRKYAYSAILGISGGGDDNDGADNDNDDDKKTKGKGKSRITPEEEERRKREEEEKKKLYEEKQKKLYEISKLAGQINIKNNEEVLNYCQKLTGRKVKPSEFTDQEISKIIQSLKAEITIRAKETKSTLTADLPTKTEEAKKEEKKEADPRVTALWNRTKVFYSTEEFKKIVKEKWSVESTLHLTDTQLTEWASYIGNLEVKKINEQREKEQNKTATIPPTQNETPDNPWNMARPGQIDQIEKILVELNWSKERKVQWWETYRKTHKIEISTFPELTNVQASSLIMYLENKLREEKLSRSLEAPATLPPTADVTEEEARKINEENMKLAMEDKVPF